MKNRVSRTLSSGHSLFCEQFAPRIEIAYPAIRRLVYISNCYYIFLQRSLSRALQLDRNIISHVLLLFLQFYLFIAILIARKIIPVEFFPQRYPLFNRSILGDHY